MSIVKKQLDDRIIYELLDDFGHPFLWANEFLSYLSDVGRSPNTIRAYGYDLQYFMRFLAISDLPVQGARPKHLVEFMTYLRHDASVTARRAKAGEAYVAHPRRPRRLSDSSVSRALAAVANFYEFLIVSEFFEAENPVLTVPDSTASFSGKPNPAMGASSRQQPMRRRIRIAQVHRLPRPMPEQDVERFIDSLSTKRDRAFFLLCLNGGLRPAEALLLKLGDIRYGLRQVIVRVDHDDPRGLRTKSRSERIVDLADIRTLAAVSAYVMHERPRDADTDLVFLVGRNGDRRTQPVSYWAMNTMFASRLTALGIRNPWTTPHALRHTHATAMHEGGMRDMTLQKRLGHESPQSTKIYTRVSDHTVRDDYLAVVHAIKKANNES